MMPGTKNIKEEVLDLTHDIKDELSSFGKSKPNNENRIDKIKQSLGNIEWIYGKIFKDLNGFVETHEKNTDLLNFKEEESLHLRNELNRLQGKVDILMKKLHTSSSSLQNIRSNYQLRMQEIEHIREDLLKKSSEESTRRRKVESEYKRLKDGYRSKTKELSSAKDHATRLAQQIEDLKNTLKSQIQKQKDDSKERALFEKVKIVATERDRLKGANEQLQASISSHKEQILALRESISTMKVERAKFEEHILTREKKILDLVQSNKDFEKKYSDVYGALNNKVNELKLVQENNKSMDENRKVLLTKIRAFEKDLESVTNETHMKSLEIQALKSEIADLQRTTEDYNQLVAQITEKELNEQALESEVTQLSAELSEAKAEVAKKLTMIASYKEEIDDFRNQERKLQLDFVEKENSYQTKIDQMQIQKDELQSLNFSLKSDVGAQANEIKNQQELIESLEKKYKGSLEQNISDQQEIEKLSASVQALEIKNKQIIVELEMAIKEGERAHAEQEELRHEIQALKEQLEAEEEKSRKALEEKFFESEKLASVNSSYAEAVDEIKTLKDKAISAKDKVIAAEEKARKAEAHAFTAAAKLATAEAISERLSSEKYVDVERIEALEKQLEVEIEKIKTVSEEKTKESEKLSALSVDHDQAMSRIKSYEEQVTSLQGQLEQQQGENQKTVVELGVTAEKVAILEASLGQLTLEKAQIEALLATEKSQTEILVAEAKAQAQDELEAQQLLMQEEIKAVRSEAELQRQDLEEAIKAIKLDAESQRQGLEDELSQTKESLRTVQSQVQKAQDQTQTAIVKLAESETIRAQLASEKYIDTEQIQSLQNTLEEASQKTNKAIVEKAKIENRLVQERRVNEDLQIKLENALGELAEAEDSLISLSESYGLEQDRYRTLQLNLNELENYRKELEEQQSVLEESLNQEKEINEDLQNKLEASKVALESMQLKEIEFMDMEKELRLQNESLTSENKDLKERVEMIEREINTRKEFYKKTVKDYETKIGEYNAKVDEANAAIEELRAEMQTMQEENQARVQELEGKLGSVGQAETDKLEVLSKREEKLNYYSRWVDIQKQNLQGHVLTLAKEMKASLEINPLKAYLKITEKEISNMKIALGKMMAFDPNKPQAEAQYEQLILQRDEVKEALDKLAEEVETRVADLKNMLKSSEFVPAPPLPPTK